MNFRGFLSAVIVVVLSGFILHPLARADEWNQMTKFHFNEAIELPGRVLPAGSYWFVLGDHEDRNLVDIYSSNWAHKLATLFTVPTHRLQTTDDTEVKFAERPHNRPEALLKWYYPGDTLGHEFMYSDKHEKEFRRDPSELVVVRHTGMLPGAKSAATGPGN
jgi:hypothetical protein